MLSSSRKLTDIQRPKHLFTCVHTHTKDSYSTQRCRTCAIHVPRSHVASMRAYVHAYEHRLACSTTCAQTTNERANRRNESPPVQSRWWSSRNQSLTSSYHSSARGDQLIARSQASPPVRSSAAIGHQRLRSRVIVGRRRTSSPVAHPSCHPVPSRIRQYGRADDSQRTFYAVYLPSALTRHARVFRHAGSSR